MESNIFTKFIGILLLILLLLTTYGMIVGYGEVRVLCIFTFIIPATYFSFKTKNWWRQRKSIWTKS